MVYVWVIAPTEVLLTLQRSPRVHSLHRRDGRHDDVCACGAARFRTCAHFWGPKRLHWEYSPGGSCGGGTPRSCRMSTCRRTGRRSMPGTGPKGRGCGPAGPVSSRAWPPPTCWGPTAFPSPGPSRSSLRNGGRRRRCAYARSRSPTTKSSGGPTVTSPPPRGPQWTSAADGRGTRPWPSSMRWPTAAASPRRKYCTWQTDMRAPRASATPDWPPS